MNHHPPQAMLAEIILHTPVATPGMVVADTFSLIAQHRLPGIPFMDRNGKLAGRVSVKHVLATSCIAKDVLNHAHLLGDFLDSLRIPPQRLQEIMQMPIEPFIIPALPSISSYSPFIKALALMEQYNSSYIFVIDDDKYQGMITLEDLARFVLERCRLGDYPA